MKFSKSKNLKNEKSQNKKNGISKIKILKKPKFKIPFLYILKYERKAN